MTEMLIQIGLSNAAIALGLAAAAIIVEKTVKRPHLAHLLWLLVFVKLITPAVVSVPVFSATGDAASDIQLLDGNTEALAAVPIAIEHESASSPLLNFWTGLKYMTIRWFPAIWLSGIVLVFAGSMVRIIRFHRLLSANTKAAPDAIQVMASSVARRLGMRSAPVLYTTTAPLSPMVWWLGGKVRIVIPDVLCETLDCQQLEWIVGHELAHVRRRDHWVRWIEWAGCVCFWWNPVAWWAQRRLRANEEICCDALVVSSLHPEPRSYADCLLTVIEHLAAPAVRPPVVASEINSGGFLERRFNMILSENFQRKNSGCLQVCVLLLAVVILPVSMAAAKDCADRTDAYLEQAWTKLQAEVEAGTITAEEAEAKMSEIEEQVAKRAEIGAYFERVWANLQAQVAAGELTAEDAEVMMGAVKKRFAEKAKREKYEAAVDAIKAAVEAGEITEEQAEERFAGLRRWMAQEKHKDVDWEAIQRRIEEAVEAGEMTREEANAKHREIRERIAQSQHKDVDWDGIKRRIEGAVERGELTREEADAKYAEIKRRMAMGNKKQGEAMRKRYAIAIEQIKAAVDAGEITEEQAVERIDGMKRQFAQAKRKNVDWEGIKRRIEGAVERGELTREEADAKYAEIKKRMAGDKNTTDQHRD